MTVLGVTWDLLWQTIWVSFAAGIAVAVLFSLVILAGARASDARRAGQDGAAVAFGVLAALTFLIFAAGVVLGVQVMLTK
jgi:uncharacterized membrane protein